MSRPTTPGPIAAFFLRPGMLVALLAVNLFAYFTGLTLWYGPVMTDTATPMWAWAFIPDCPLFAWLGALGLLLVAARTWGAEEQRRLRLVLVGSGVLAAGIAGSSAAGWLPPAWQGHDGMWSLLAISLLGGGLLVGREANWLLAVIAVGQIKYGLWTITAWVLFWRNTSAFYGAPIVSPESVLMTASHVGLALQGVLLLSFVRPTPGAVAAVLGWFVLSDFVDYGLGWYPAIPPIIPLVTIQRSTVFVTWALGLSMAGILLWRLGRPDVRHSAR